MLSSIRALILLSLASCVIAAQEPQTHPLAPAESLAALTTPADLKVDLVLSEPQIVQPVFLNFDERGRMWVVEYRQYPAPAGLKLLSHDTVYRAVYDKVPAPPPNHVPGRDRISIHESTKGDGVYDKHTVFVDGLNIVTAVERGRGGVWVLNPPYLLFYPDRNNDDIPDGPPEVHLEGFGLEDTHSVVNSLRWGPDGWLYAAQGSTVSGHVKRPGDKDAVQTLGQLIWRYHPETHRYEIFAEGGGNTFGVELDDKGRIFSGHNGGDTRGFHYVQGGYSRKGFDKHGPLSNPYAFGYFDQMKHDTKVPRFTHNWLTYQGGALPENYNGKIFGCNPLLSQVTLSELIPDGSTFRTRDIGAAITSADKWFRPVDIKLGPDGNIYVCDWYDKQVAHLRTYAGQVDDTNGRIYRLRGKDSEFAKPVDYGAKSTPESVAALQNKNRWVRQAALRLLGDRRDANAIPLLKKAVFDTGTAYPLDALWGLYQSGGLDEETALQTLKHNDPFVRSWTVRLLCDEKFVSIHVAHSIEEMALTEPNVETRNQIACSARRLPLVQCFGIVKALTVHKEDADDPQIPLLLWWALESKYRGNTGTGHGEALLSFFEDRGVWDSWAVLHSLPNRAMRRLASDGSPPALANCAKLFALWPYPEHPTEMLKGFEQAFEGRAMPPLPPELQQALANAGGDTLPLDLRMGKAEAFPFAWNAIQNSKEKLSKRLTFLQILGELHRADDLPKLLPLLRAKDPALIETVLGALQQFDDAAIGDAILEAYPQFSATTRVRAQSVLSSRTSWSAKLLQAVEKGTIERQAIAREVVDQLRQQDDPQIAALVEKFWGKARASAPAEVSDDLRAEMKRVAATLATGGGDPLKGRPLFAQRCGICHTLFGTGGRVGPDLTPFKRDDLDAMLVSIVAPSAEIREGFENMLIKTKDGRRLSGIVVQQDPASVLLRGADGADTNIARAQIDLLKPAGKSIMPENILTGVSDEDLRHLFAYLRSSQPPR